MLLNIRRISLIKRQFYQGANRQLRQCFSSPRPNIHLSKNNVLVDEKVEIKVTNLEKGQKVTLQTCLTEDDKTFGSCGHFIADSQGCVSTFRDVSHGGTYEGYRLYSYRFGTDGIILDVMNPFVVTIAVQDGFQEFDRLPWSHNLPCICSSLLYRSYSAQGIQRFPVSEDGLYGVLFVPPGEGPFPAVIDLFGLGGGLFEFRSALLASHGFASFAVAYVGLPGLPKNELEIDFIYFLKAFDWLEANKFIDKESIAGVATCVGGGYLQFIASKRPAMKCFITINGTGVPYGFKQYIEGEEVQTNLFRFDRIRKKDDLFIFKEMTQPGEHYPVCQFHFSVESRFYATETSGLSVPWFDATETAGWAVPCDNNFLVEGWRHGAKILAIHGLDDQSINPLMKDYYEAAMPEEFKENFTTITYPMAGHLIEPPYTPWCRKSYNKLFRMNLSWGGEANQHSLAQEEAWLNTLLFLDKNIGRKRQTFHK